MMANVVASAPTGAVRAISTSIGTMLSWPSGAEMVVSTKANVRALTPSQSVDSVERPMFGRYRIVPATTTQNSVKLTGRSVIALRKTRRPARLSIELTCASSPRNF